MKREDALSLLCDGLWHTTSPRRYLEILRTGEIRPEPDVPDCDRWSTSSRPEKYPYVRSKGGVSLFDFRGFDPKRYEEECPLSNWHEFVPFRKIWGAAIWIKFDESIVHSGDVIAGKSLVEMWKHEEQYGRRIMPYIEVAHIGAIGISKFKSVFLMCINGTLDITDVRLLELNTVLAPWQSPGCTETDHF